MKNHLAEMRGGFVSGEIWYEDQIREVGKKGLKLSHIDSGQDRC